MVDISLIGTVLLRCELTGHASDFYKSGRGEKMLRSLLGEIAYRHSDRKIFEKTKIPYGLSGSFQYSIAGREIPFAQIADYQIVFYGEIDTCDISKKQACVEWIERIFKTSEFTPEDALIRITISDTEWNDEKKKIDYKFDTTIYTLNGRRLKEFYTNK